MKIKKIEDTDKIKVELPHRELIIIQTLLKELDINDINIEELNSGLFDKDEIQEREQLENIANKMKKKIAKKLTNIYPY